MSKVIGFKKNFGNHTITCNICDAIIEFDNSDILRDEMGCQILCPNCGHWIKF